MSTFTNCLVVFLILDVRAADVAVAVSLRETGYRIGLDFGPELVSAALITGGPDPALVSEARRSLGLRPLVVAVRFDVPKAREAARTAGYDGCVTGPVGADALDRLLPRHAQ